jgi:hypothetical protein
MLIMYKMKEKTLKYQIKNILILYKIWFYLLLFDLKKLALRLEFPMKKMKNYEFDIFTKVLKIIL